MASNWKEKYYMVKNLGENRGPSIREVKNKSIREYRQREGSEI